MDKTWQNMEREHFPCSSAHLIHLRAKNLFLGRSKCHQNTLFKRQHPPVMLTRSSQTALMAYTLHQLALPGGGFFPKQIITTQVKSNWWYFLCFFHIILYIVNEQSNLNLLIGTLTTSYPCLVHVVYFCSASCSNLHLCSRGLISCRFTSLDERPVFLISTQDS